MSELFVCDIEREDGSRYVIVEKDDPLRVKSGHPAWNNARGALIHWWQLRTGMDSVVRTLYPQWRKLGEFAWLP